MRNLDKPKIGMVALVGAGPGEPDWITVRGLQLLRMADVVVYDALANPVLLDEAPAAAERIDAGKRAKDHKLTQDQTNQLMLDKARQGLLVVRLKGGDPYLFGRGAEEVAFLAHHGVRCEVVPGVTSGIAAPMAAGIPVTHREHASTVTFVTGHEDPTKSDTAIDYASLAGLIKSGGTACFYMGVGRLASIVTELCRHGLPPETPAAVVQWGATPRQRTVRGALNKIEEAVRSANLGPPAIIVVGSVAAIDEPGLDFYVHRPLFGKRIVITRTRHQASALHRKLAELGAEVLEAPTIELIEPPPEELEKVEDAIRNIRDYQWVMLTSTNGVAALDERLKKLNLDARHLAGVKFAAIGDATADEMQSRLRLSADLIPTTFVAESLAADLIAKHDIRNKKILLLRADIAHPALPQLLTQAGAKVTELSVYQTRTAASLPAAVVQALREKQVDWVTFTSSSTARNMVELIGSDRALLNQVKTASIGPITSETLRELGLPVTVEAGVSNIDGLVRAMAGGE